MSRPEKSKLLHFLLVDDDEDDRELFKEVAGEILLTAIISTVNGHKPLMQYLSKANSSLPDFIFLDINMPGKDGIELLRDLKADGRYRHLPIGMYSTSSSPDLIEKAFSLGAYIYICKPTSIASIRKILSEVLNADWKIPL